MGRPPSTRGRLLVATPPLVDPHFDRTVVLILGHDAEGAIGLVLNRPTTDATVPGLDRWLEAAAPPAVVFAGGPVDTDALIGLATAPDADGTGLSTVDLDADPVEAMPEGGAFRLFRGYAGWGAGQLDTEIEDGAWMVLDRESDDTTTAHPDDLWRHVLRRQGGRLAWLATCPDDLALN